MGNQRLERRLDARLVVVGDEGAGEDLFERASRRLAAITAQRLNDRLDQLRQIARVERVSDRNVWICSRRIQRRLRPRLTPATRRRGAGRNRRPGSDRRLV